MFSVGNLFSWAQYIRDRETDWLYLLCPIQTPSIMTQTRDNMLWSSTVQTQGSSFLVLLHAYLLISSHSLCIYQVFISHFGRYSSLADWGHGVFFHWLDSPVWALVFLFGFRHKSFSALDCQLYTNPQQSWRIDVLLSGVSPLTYRSPF
jgi:hypothetical protein